MRLHQTMSALGYQNGVVTVVKKSRKTQMLRPCTNSYKTKTYRPGLQKGNESRIWIGLSIRSI